MPRRWAEHSDFKQLHRRIAGLKTAEIRLDLIVFRCVEPAYANERDLLTGEGSRRHGGRWNPPGSFATVYAACSDATALAESKAGYFYYGLDPADAMPRTIVAIDVKIATVLDLTDPVIRKCIGLSITRMRRDDWRLLNRRGEESLTRSLGRATYLLGLEGLLAPACDGGRNLIWFPGNLAGSSNASIRNVKKLC